MKLNLLQILTICLLFSGCYRLANSSDSTVSDKHAGYPTTFKVLDTESEAVLKNIEVKIPDYKKLLEKSAKEKQVFFCGFGSSKDIPKKTIRANRAGSFKLPQEALDGKSSRTFYIPKLQSTLTFLIFDNKLYSTIYRRGFGKVQVVGKNIYDLDSMVVKRIRYFEDKIVVEPYDEIELFPITNFYRAKEIIDDLDQAYYAERHSELWAYLLADFKQVVGYDIQIHPNTKIWNQYVFRVLPRFKDIGLDPLIELYEATTAIEEKYNLLFAIIRVRHYKIQRNEEVVFSQEEKVKALFDSFYKEHAVYITKISDFHRDGDFLKKELTKNEKQYYSYNNASIYPNVKDRLKLVSN